MSFFSFLPTLPSLPFPLVPKQLQQRLLAFLLRKSVGHFIKGQLDTEKIEADLSKGSAKVAELELDHLAIDPLLENIPQISFQNGTIGAISTQVVWPLSLSSTLSILVEDIELVFLVTRLQETASNLNETVASVAPGDEEEIILALSVASEFIKEELTEVEDAQLRESLHGDSPEEIERLPGAFAFKPLEINSDEGVDKEEVTMLAGVIERIMSRLNLRIRNVKVRLIYETEVEGDDIQMEMRIADIRYADESESSDSTIRTIRISSPSIHLRTPSPTPASPTLSTRSTRSSESSNSSDSSFSPTYAMLMSQSIADLRESTISSSIESSLYASATGASILGSVAEVEIEESRKEDEGWCEVLHFGTDDIVATLETKSTTPINRKNVELDFNVQVNQDITFILAPSQIRLLFNFYQIFLNSSQQSLPPKSTVNKVPNLSIKFEVKSIDVILIYENSPIQLSNILTPSFWLHPISSKIPLSHLRLHLHKLSINNYLPTSTLKIMIESVLLTEYARIDTTEMRSLPILVTDSNLGQQPDGATNAMGPISLESKDWLKDLTGEGRSWRTKGVKVKKGSKVDSIDVKPAILVSCVDDSTSIELQPIHLFLDVGIISRIMPFISSLPVPIPQQARSVSPPSTPRPRSQRPIPLSPLRLLEELSFEAQRQTTSKPKLEVSLSLLRIEVRCPAPTKAGKRKSNKVVSTESVRSGILVADFNNISIRKGQPSSNGDEGMEIGCDQMICSFLPGQATLAKAFLSISNLTQDLSDSQTQSPSTPLILIHQIAATNDPSTSTDTLTSNSTITSIDFRLPQLKTSLDKVVLDGLQLFVDDLSQWSAQEFGDDERSGSSTPNPKMLGSRYFGAKSFARRRGESESGDSSAIDGSKAMVIKLSISDVLLDLYIHKLSSTKSQSHTRNLRATVLDLKLQVEVLKNGRNDLQAELNAMDVRIEDRTIPSTPIVLLDRVTARSLTLPSTPSLQLKFVSAVEKETGRKESKIDLTLSNLVYFLFPDFSWIQDVALYAKAPPGAFESAVPNELTRIRLHLKDNAIYVTPPNVKSRTVVSLGHLDISTDLMPDMPRSLAIFKIQDLRLLAIDDVLELKDQSNRDLDHWAGRGFISLFQFRESTVRLRQGNGMVLPDLEAVVSDTKIEISLCADSISVISALISDFTSSMKSSTPAFKLERRKSTSSSFSSDLLSSVDPSAFDQAEALYEMLEYLDDDVPANLDYLSDALHGTGSNTPVAAEKTKLKSSGQIISNIEGETIKMFSPNGLQISDGFLDYPRLDSDSLSTKNQPSVVRFELVNCDVKIQLHEGFDWNQTRTAIESEVKAMSRRLEKIRQLLTAGQTPDEEASDASITLFGSVKLGLAAGASNLPPTQLLAAINEELEEVSDAVSSAGTFIPTATPSNPLPSTKSSIRLRKLHRSKQHAIEINLKCVNLNYDSFPDSNQVAMKMRLDVDSFEIIDNIKTSTWKKFLTELKASDGGTIRASDSSMARLELSTTRSMVKQVGKGDEIVVKLKISPLRLYIDQDALDFLKAFGAFTATVDSHTVTAPANEPFFQRFEILPVKIKLDYKPKRVDYQALRKGKIAEMMNFFHFDGSEMTLRHLVITGISGTTQLSDLIQDIWTPDVKANQLADVVSGIAPVRSVVNIGSGIANLILLPIEQYKKDGRIGRGLQKGLSSFTQTTTLEAINIGARLATGTQVILEQAESILSCKNSTSSPITSSTSVESLDPISNYANPPQDLQSGISLAIKSMETNLISAAQTILALPIEVYEKSDEGVIQTVVRAVPIAILKTSSGASKAISLALMGAKGSLFPGENSGEDKYKR